jgi:hypothetical protein
MQKLGKLLLHIESNVSRYATLLTAVLTPLAALLGAVAAQLGGVDTGTGRALLAAASAVGTAVAGVTWIYNRGKWERTVGNILSEDDKLGLGDIIRLAKSTLSEVETAAAQLPKKIDTGIDKPAPDTAIKPHKPVQAPPTVPPVVTPPAPVPPPTHPAPKTNPNPVRKVLGKVGGLLGKVVR